MSKVPSAVSIRASTDPREIARVLFGPVPVPRPPKPAPPQTKSITKHLEPYDPDAQDGDGDGIVQDGTPWERPAGARLLDELGHELRRGLDQGSAPKKIRIVDGGGNDIAYTPSRAATPPPQVRSAEEVIQGPQPKLQSLKDRGLRPVTEIVAQARQPAAPSAPAPSAVPDLPAVTRGPGISVPDNPEFHGVDRVLPNGFGNPKHGELQKYGDQYQQTVRGVPIAWDDDRIPEVVYHVTPALQAIQRDGIIRAGGAGGLGGDDKDRIVSMTTNRKVAEQLVSDMRLVRSAGLARDTDGLLDVLRADARHHGVELSDKTWADVRYYADRDGAHSGLNFYFVARDTAGGPRSPLFFGLEDTMKDFARRDEADFGMVEIPRKNLDTGALLTNFDLGQGYLDEIRLYGDVPISKAAAPDVPATKWAPTDTHGMTVGGLSTSDLMQALSPADAKRLKVLANSQAVSSNAKQAAELRELKQRALKTIGEKLGFSEFEITEALGELHEFESQWYDSGGRKPVRDAGEAAWQALRDGKVPETPMERAVALQKAYTDMVWDLRHGPDEKVSLIRGVRDDYAARILLAEAMGVEWSMDTHPLTSWALSSKGRPSVIGWIDRTGRTQKVLLETEVSRKDAFALYHAEAEARDPSLRVKAEYIVAGGTSGKLSIAESGYGDLWEKDRSKRSVQLAQKQIERTGVDLDGYWLNKDMMVSSRLAVPSYQQLEEDRLREVERIRPYWAALGFDEVPEAWATTPRLQDGQDAVDANFAARAAAIQDRGLTFAQVSNLLYLWDSYQHAVSIFPEDAADRLARLRTAQAALGIKAEMVR